MEAARCRLCGRDVSMTDARQEPGADYCSSGCETIAATLGTPPTRPTPRRLPEDSPRNNEPTRIDHSPDTPSAATSTFFRIDGMYSVTCEEYLESVANNQPGVMDAEASYVTESIRVVHNPDQSPPGTIRDALSTLGYTAFERDRTTPEDDTTGPTRIAREQSGVRKRRAEQFLALRHAAGLLFGAFLLLPYVTIIYPAHLSTFLDWAFLESFTDALQFGSQGMLAFLRLYFVLTGVILIFTGLPVLRGAYISVKMRRPTTDLLVAMTVLSAYAYSTLVVFLGRNDLFFDLTIVVAASVTTAVFYEAGIKKRGLKRLTDLTISSVSTATRYNGPGSIEEVPVSDITTGDRLLVREGERVPLDGTIIEGECSVDERVISGESLPVEKHPGDPVVGGSIVLNNAIIVDVDPSESSSYARLTRSMWELQSTDHGVHRLADRLVGKLLPFVIGSALLVSLGIAWVGQGIPSMILYFLLVVLVTSPWALGLATPMAVAYGINAALDRDIVIFNESVFERLRSVDYLVFDKTGTLTSGQMTVVETDLPTPLYEAVGLIELRASHPVATAITDDVFSSTRPLDLDQSRENTDASTVKSDRHLEDFTSYASGVKGIVDGDELLVGSLSFFEEQHWEVSQSIRQKDSESKNTGRLPVIAGKNGRAEGVVVLGDEPRDEWGSTLENLGSHDIEVVVLTGDTAPATEPFASHQGVTHVFSGVPPEGKKAAIDRLRTRGTVAMVGDGTNDALALAAADLGISLGSGTALAADAADVTIANNAIQSVESIFTIANETHERLTQNIKLSGSYNAIALIGVFAGIFNPLVGATAVIVTLGVLLLNCSRSYK